MRAIKIIFVVFLVLVWDCTSSVVETFNQRIDEKVVMIEELENENDRLREVQKRTESTYKESVRRMVENVYRNDSFLNVGGSTDIIDYDENMFIQLMDDPTYELNQFLKDSENFFDARSNYFSEIPDVWPLKYHELNRITSPFGPRFDPFGKHVVGIHNGIDLASIWKAEIIATADGIIQDHWIYHKEFGRSVRIQHDNGFQTFYGHLAVSYVHEGQKVKKGDVIGLMGNTGIATGAHIHYEVIKNGMKVDPINYLRRQVGIEEEKYVYEIQ